MSVPSVTFADFTFRDDSNDYLMEECHAVRLHSLLTHMHVAKSSRLEGQSGRRHDPLCLVLIE